MKKKCLLLFGAMLLYMALFSANASATTYISSAEQLMAITDMSETYILSKDIDLKGKAWTALGGTTDDTCFAGVFNGNGHTISNLTGKNGLFAMSTGTVKNVTLDETCVISSGTGYYVGAIAGTNQGTIENCVNHANITTSSVANTGGICGRNSNGTIKKCVNTGALKATGKPTTETYMRAGGICGYMIGSATIDQCWNQGSVWVITNANSSAVTAYAGGIVGVIESSSALVSNTYNTGTVTAEANKYGSGALAGGITALMERVSEIRTSYNVGTVTADPMYSSDLYRSYCFAIAGLKTSGTHVSTPVGTCIDCYYLDGSYVEIAQNKPQTTGTTACAAEQLKQKATFSGFNFSTIWMIDGGSTYQYPVLRATHDCSHASDQLKRDTATCTATGSKIYTCNYCGKESRRVPSEALGHKWGDWATVKEPTYTCVGTESRTCGRCSETEERDIAPTGQAVVDEIQKTQDGNAVTLEKVPEDITVLGAAYFDGRMVFAQILEPAAGSGTLCVPEDTAWDLMKVFFSTEQWIPVARTADYRPQQNR